VAQLRTYRAARPRVCGSRYLVWGIVENSDRPDLTVEELKTWFANASEARDVWVFSSFNAITEVLQAALNL